MKTLHVPTYHDVLDEANFWRREPSPDSLRKAAEILERGIQAHPYALALTDELALVYQKQDDDHKAWDLLQRAERSYGELSEETLARFGKIHKKLADEKLRAGHRAAAVDHLVESERYYRLSFEKRRGFYPRINEMTVRFLRAGILARLGKQAEADELVTATRQDAAAMLADPAMWAERQPDDNVWSIATRAEASVLLADWPAAKAAYREAVRLANGQRMYPDTMAAQIRNNLAPAYHMLALEFDSELASADFFTLPETPK